MANLQNFLQERQNLINNFLEKALKPKLLNKTAIAPERLWQAMSYSCLNGGKRLRGILCLATYEAFKPNYLAVLPIAAGLECIHAMSLVHDDLPCMDNDILRRGKPTCHIQFDTATALLAGDGLLIEGLALCLQADELNPQIMLKIMPEIMQAIGANGMTGGQSIDLENTNKNVSLLELENMHKLKTGAFLKASVLVSAMAAEATESQLKALEIYAEKIGLAFQIIDDLLDLEGDSAQIGKTAGKDLAQNKATYPKFLGLEQSKEKAQNLIEEAKLNLIQNHIYFPPLHQIADYIIQRKK